MTEPLVAYVSMEIAVASGVATYSGGLGVLAGDVVRAAADAGYPMAGVTLLYRDGYFRQHLDASGGQHEEPQTWRPDAALEQLAPVVTLHDRRPPGHRRRLALPGRGRRRPRRAGVLPRHRPARERRSRARPYARALRRRRALPPRARGAARSGHGHRAARARPRPRRHVPHERRPLRAARPRTARRVASGRARRALARRSRARARALRLHHAHAGAGRTRLLRSRSRGGRARCRRS